MTQIPAGWEETTLGKACIVMSWSTPSTKEELYRDWDISWITPKDLSNYNERYIAEGERNITEAWVKNSSAQILPPNTILFSSRAPIWYVAIAKKELTTNQGFKNIICDEKESHYLFFYYWLKYRSEYIEKISSGSTFTEASAAIMRSLPIHLPLLPEQQAIAAVLSSFDDKIELLRAENQTLEQMGQELFKERFGKWKVGDELPEGWRVAADYIAFEKGVEVWSSNYYEKQGANFEFLPFYRVGDIASNGAISNIFCDKGLLKEKIFYTNDVLLSLDGTVGRVFIWWAGWYSSGIRKLVALNSEISQAFLYFWAKSEDVQKTISLYSEWTTIQHAGKSIPYLMISADIEKIKNSSKILNVRFDKILLNLEQIQSLSATRDQLLPKLMSWEVRVEF